MERTGTNQNSLAAKAGLKADAIRDVMRGNAKTLGADKLTALAKFLERTPGQLLGIEPMPGAASEDEVVSVQPPRLGDTLKAEDEVQLLTVWRQLSFRQKVAVLDFLDITPKGGLV